MTRANLRAVPSVEAPVDIAALNRADIVRRDWSACHVAGDRSPPLELGERIKRTWWR